ncbi:hypothetical protein F2P81_013692 [Scophthalmus maximus]|uniref:Uncharacterized protein n=1 Tax=Scophthalmus maximus TaxID=52904 RepID=A0A6A4SEQ8_SCOMX|nr:hypothetical protein F2P81_013692 [Scophthalmus maximus]
MRRVLVLAHLRAPARVPIHDDDMLATNRSTCTEYDKVCRAKVCRNLLDHDDGEHSGFKSEVIAQQEQADDEAVAFSYEAQYSSYSTSSTALLHTATQGCLVQKLYIGPFWQHSDKTPNGPVG